MNQTRRNTTNFQNIQNMNIQDVIKACGPLQQAPQVIPVGNKKGNGLEIAVVILIGVTCYLINREWKRKSDLENQ